MGWIRQEKYEYGMYDDYETTECFKNFQLSFDSF